MELLPQTVERPYVPLDEEFWADCVVSPTRVYESEWLHALELCDTDLVYSYFRQRASKRLTAVFAACVRQWWPIVIAHSHHASLLAPEPENEVERRFAKYLNQWRRETWFMSSVKKRTANINYLSIVSLGRPAIPLILQDLKRSGDHWFLALRVLADEDPAEGSGDFNQQREAWLQWGSRKGHL